MWYLIVSTPDLAPLLTLYISFQDVEDEEDKRVTEVEIVIKKSDSFHRQNSYDTLGEDNKAYVAPIYRCTSV